MPEGFGTDQTTSVDRNHCCGEEMSSDLETTGRLTYPCLDRDCFRSITADTLIRQGKSNIAVSAFSAQLGASAGYHYILLAVDLISAGSSKSRRR